MTDMFGTSEPDPMTDLSNLADGFRDPSTYSGFPDPAACRADAHPEAWANLIAAHRVCLFAALTHQSRRVADRELGGALAAAAQGAFDAAIGGIQEFWSDAALTYSMVYSHLSLPDTDDQDGHDYTTHDFCIYTGDGCVCDDRAAERAAEAEERVDAAVSELFAIIDSDRNSHTAGSVDPYRTALTLWVSAVPRVRNILAPLDRSEVALGLVETVYREALTAWLRGDPPRCLACDPDDLVTARYFDDDRIEEELREAIDPPAVWIF